MQFYAPEFYSQFRCLAAACPDSCCKDWEIQIDAASARYYQSLPGSLGQRLRQHLLPDADGGAVMALESGRCPMWRADGLCAIQAQLGADALCQTCRDYPRLPHDYGVFVERGLELSCPEAARLILTAPQVPVLAPVFCGSEDVEYDREAMSVLLSTRANALRIVGERAHSVQEALALLLLYGCHAQQLLDSGEASDFSPEALLPQAKALAGEADVRGFLDFFAGLEILTPQWRSRLEKPCAPAAWSGIHRNLAGYGIGRYWLQAIADYDLLNRVKLVVISCILVRLLGGDSIATAQLYAKEIENDAENLDAILDGADSHPALSDRQLLNLLLGK